MQELDNLLERLQDMAENSPFDQEDLKLGAVAVATHFLQSFSMEEIAANHEFIEKAMNAAVQASVLGMLEMPELVVSEPSVLIGFVEDEAEA